MNIDTTQIKTQITNWVTNRSAEIDALTTKIENAVSAGDVNLLPVSLKQAYTAQKQSKVDLQTTQAEFVDLIEKVEHLWTMLGN